MTIHQAIPVTELPPQRMSSVVGVRILSSTTLRLMEMGLVPGAPVRVVRVAPFGGPVELDVMGTRLCVRRRDAADVLVEP
jgi:ferrous iron transport protein A